MDMGERADKMTSGEMQRAVGRVRGARVGLSLDPFLPGCIIVSIAFIRLSLSGYFIGLCNDAHGNAQAQCINSSISTH